MTYQVAQKSFIKCSYVVNIGAILIGTIVGIVPLVNAEDRFKCESLSEIVFDTKIKWNSGDPTQQTYFVADYATTKDSQWLVSLVVKQSREKSRFVRDSLSWKLIAVNRDGTDGRCLYLNSEPDGRSRVEAISANSEDRIHFVLKREDDSEHVSFELIEWIISADEVKTTPQQDQFRDIDPNHFEILMALADAQGRDRITVSNTSVTHHDFLRRRMGTSRSWPDPFGKFSTWCINRRTNNLIMLSNTKKPLSIANIGSLESGWTKNVLEIANQSRNTSLSDAPMWLPRSEVLADVIPIFLRTDEGAKMLTVDDNGVLKGEFTYEFDYPAFQLVSSDDGSFVSGVFYKKPESFAVFVDINVHTGLATVSDIKVRGIFSSEKGSIFCADNDSIFLIDRNNHNAVSAIWKYGERIGSRAQSN